MLLSSDNNKEGNNNRFASIAKSKVTETKAPSATVPPKFEIVKTEKPKNKTIEV